MRPLREEAYMKSIEVFNFIAKETESGKNFCAYAKKSNKNPKFLSENSGPVTLHSKSPDGCPRVCPRQKLTNKVRGISAISFT